MTFWQRVGQVVAGVLIAIIVTGMVLAFLGFVLANASH